MKMRIPKLLGAIFFSNCASDPKGIQEKSILETNRKRYVTESSAIRHFDFNQPFSVSEASDLYILPTARTRLEGRKATSGGGIKPPQDALMTHLTDYLFFFFLLPTPVLLLLSAGCT